MNNIKISKNFSLENFIDIYTSNAFELASKKVSLDDFDKNIRENVSKYLDIPSEIISMLHHPFHWTFFIDEGHPFEYIQSIKKGEITRVRPQKIYTKEDIESYNKLILKTYGDYLKAKIDTLTNNQ